MRIKKFGVLLIVTTIVFGFGLSGCETLDNHVYKDSNQSRNTMAAGALCAGATIRSGSIGSAIGLGIACGAIAYMLSDEDCVQTVAYAPAKDENGVNWSTGDEYKVAVGVAGHCVTNGNGVQIHKPVVAGDAQIVSIMSMDDFCAAYPSSCGYIKTKRGRREQLPSGVSERIGDCRVLTDWYEQQLNMCSVENREGLHCKYRMNPAAEDSIMCLGVAGRN